MAFWNEFQHNASSLGRQRLHGLRLWTTHRIWLMKFQRAFEPLRVKMKPSLHTAKIWTRWFSTVMPLNTDTILLFLLMADFKRGKPTKSSK